MQIIGFGFTEISIKRKEKAQGQIQVKQNINIDELVKNKISFSDKESVKIDFTFSVDYNDKKFASVEIKGQVTLLPEKEELKQIMKSWKDKKLPEDIRTPIFNFIMTKGNIKALALEDELNLPLHIPFPKIKNQ